MRDRLEERVEGLQDAARPEVAGGDDAGGVPHALEVALRPPGALGQQAAKVGQALLGDPGVGDVAHLVTAEDHVEAQLVVLQEGAALPGAAFGGGDAVQGGQTGELAVAAQARRAGAVAQQLHPGVGHGELHVLHPYEQPREGVAQPAVAGQRRPVVGVAHTDGHLHAAGLRVAEPGRAADRGQRVGGQAAVGVEDADDDAAAVGACGQELVEGLVGAVQRGAFAGTGVRATALDEVDVRVGLGVRGDDRAGRVVAVVVDHPDVPGGEVAPQPRDGGADDGFLVPAGYEEVPVVGVRVTGRGDGPGLVGVPGSGPVQQEAQEQEEGEDEQREAAGGGVHEQGPWQEGRKAGKREGGKAGGGGWAGPRLRRERPRVSYATGAVPTRTRTGSVTEPVTGSGPDSVTNSGPDRAPADAAASSPNSPAIRSEAVPSPNGLGSAASRSRSSAPWASRARAARPTSGPGATRSAKSVIASGRSVEARTTTSGRPRTVTSSWTPPESEMSSAACRARAKKGA